MGDIFGLDRLILRKKGSDIYGKSGDSEFDGIRQEADENRQSPPLAQEQPYSTPRQEATRRLRETRDPYKD